MKKNGFLKALKANWWIVLVLTALTLLCILPIIHTVALSFSDQARAAAGEVFFIPKGFSVNSYAKLLKESTFLTAFWISIRRVLLALLISGGVTILAAYALSKSPQVFPGRDVYLWILVFTMLFNAGTIPWYMAIRRAGIMDTIWALVLPCAVNAYNIILMMNFFRGIPTALEEAARVDGAGPWRTLFQIYIPLSKPSIATIALFIVVYHWNNFYDGLVLMSRPSHYPLQTYIYQLTVTIDVRTITNIDTLKELLKVSGLTLNASKLVVSMVPILLVYPFLQRYFVTGLTLGAVKE
ncbi:MAG: carbohydrate ABC transporter permease [bacterium]|nr:carbohydrate ABC transporter permease [bacterium]